jgi:hypothetical protein
MKMVRSFLVPAVLLLGCWCCCGQGHSYFEYKFIFSGTAYETNAAGKLVGTPITDQTLLQDRARLGGITDLSTVAIVYHLDGNSLGDTVEVIASTNGQVLTSEFGLYFSSDSSLGRTAVTNAAQTQQIEADYIYTSNGSTYTFGNNDSVGLSITTKTFSITNGVTNAMISGSMSWGVEPQGTNGPILCIGNFSLGQPMF